MWYCFTSYVCKCIFPFHYPISPPRPGQSASPRELRTTRRGEWASTGSALPSWFSNILLRILCWLCHKLVCCFSGHTPMPIYLSNVLSWRTYVVDSLSSRLGFVQGSQGAQPSVLYIAGTSSLFISSTVPYLLYYIHVLPCNFLSIFHALPCYRD